MDTKILDSMKKVLLLPLFLILGIVSTLYVSCKKKKVQKEPLLVDEKGNPICTARGDLGETLPYNVSLLSRVDNGNGTWTWTWTVTNTNPGDGTNGTMKDLTHWDLSLGDCATAADIVQAATSPDGKTWTDFSVVLDKDKAQNCYTEPVVKFDLGTTGSQKSYYRLTLNKNFSMQKRDAVFVSKSALACGHFKICAIGCAQ